MYDHCVGIGSATMVWVGLVTLHLRRHRQLHWIAVRFILAASHVQYYVMVADEVHPEEWMTIQV